MGIDTVDNMLFTFTSLLYSLLILALFTGKKKVMTLENRMYTVVMISLCLELLTNLVIFLITSSNPALSLLFRKIHNSLLLFLAFSLTFYFLALISKKNQGYVDFKENEERPYFMRIIKIVYGITAGLILIMWFLPFEPVDEIYINYKGAGFIYTYAIIIGLIICWLVLLITSGTKDKKKFTPIIAAIIIGSIGAAAQFLFTGLFIVNALIALGVNFIFFTIGNPDLKMIEDLNITKDSADRANKAKSDFLSNMSHEIRTPLNAIVGFSEALFEEEMKPEDREDIETIHESAVGLLEIVNGILDISKMDAGKLELTETDYILNKMVNDITMSARKNIGNKKIEFVANVSDTLPQVLNGDSIKLKSIINNLISNAIKYTDSGYIELHIDGMVKNDKCRLIIYVEDTGQGIPENAVEKLFDSYEQTEKAKEEIAKGTGIGVAVTKRLVNLMGGDIYIRSAVGVGSSFIFAIDQNVIAKTSNEVEGLLNQELVIFDLTGKNVMVVDDNGVNLKVAKRLLKEYKLDVDLKQSGQECVDAIKLGSKYDLIMMDDFMPGMNGSQTLDNLKQIGGFNTPVIALTANNESNSKEKYIGLGFNSYLAKPIAKEELNKILKEFLVK